jgi:MFS transporter, DHA2 family, methylenomycin A resistance protein
VTFRYIQKERPLPRQRIDLPGQVVSLFALASLTTVLIEGTNWGWNSAKIIGLSIAFVLLAILFLRIERGQSHPMLPLSLFRSAQFSVASLLGLLLSFPFYGLIFTLSLYFQQVRHFTPLQTGFAFLPVTGLLTVMNVFSGNLAASRGMRFPIVAGFLLGGIGFFWLAFTADQEVPYLNLLPPLLCVGAGVPLILPPVTSVVLASVTRSQVGRGSATLNTGRQIGAAAGVAVLGSLLSVHQQLIIGFRWGLVLCGIIYWLSIVLTIGFIPHSLKLAGMDEQSSVSCSQTDAPARSTRRGRK